MTSKQHESLLLDQVVPVDVVQCSETLTGSVLLGLHKPCAMPRNSVWNFRDPPRFAAAAATVSESVLCVRFCVTRSNIAWAACGRCHLKSVGQIHLQRPEAQNVVRGTSYEGVRRSLRTRDTFWGEGELWHSKNGAAGVQQWTYKRTTRSFKQYDVPVLFFLLQHAVHS